MQKLKSEQWDLFLIFLERQKNFLRDSLQSFKNARPFHGYGFEFRNAVGVQQFSKLFYWSHIRKISFVVLNDEEPCSFKFTLRFSMLSKFASTRSF